MQIHAAPTAYHAPALTAPMIRRSEDSPLSDRAHKAIRTTMERGETLWLDGYTLAVLPGRGIYQVVTPERIKKTTGEMYVKVYTVDALGSTCNCPLFGFHCVCKHLYAIQKAICEAIDAQERANALLFGTPGQAVAAPLFPRSFPVPGAVWSETPRIETGRAVPVLPEPKNRINRAGLLNPAADY